MALPVPQSGTEELRPEQTLMQCGRGADEEVARQQQERRGGNPRQYNAHQAKGHEDATQSYEKPAPQARHLRDGHIVLERVLAGGAC